MTGYIDRDYIHLGDEKGRQRRDSGVSTRSHHEQSKLEVVCLCELYSFVTT